MKERPTILVVDDQANNRKLLADLLSIKGYAVVTASGGKEGLAKVHSVRPDLVLLDIIMPDLSGYDVCKKIRADTSIGILPVVMVTALDPAQERIKGLEAGADDFLTKPINQPELLARVKSLLRIKSLYDTVQEQSAELSELNAGLEKRVQEQIGQLQQLAQLKRFFPPQLAELIVAGDIDDPLQTRRREVTVAFLDLRGFTAFADTSEPEEVMGLLRNYHREMGELIHAHGGTLEEMSGNSMMVIFNDPVIVEDPAARAVRMALAMQQHFDELIVPWRKRGHDITLGIGIAHGYATIGTIGYEARLGYGVIGRVTNVAARLCKEAEPGQILVSAPVHTLVESVVNTKEVKRLDLKDFARPVAAFRILGLKSGAVAEESDQWTLKVFTLGQFSLLKKGEPLAFSRKVQRKPLDLLRLLIAFGGVQVETTRLMELLWPEAEGDAAKISFDSNLYRLRKLIDVDDMLTLAEGKISLDVSRCWVDARAFEELVDRIESASRASPPSSDDWHANCTKELLRLYTGHFLGKESQESWTISTRDRLKAKFLRAVTILGTHLEQRKEWEQAISLYSRALEMDNLAESLYRRLMTCYREQGEPAEALNVYRRCRDMLSIILTMKPSPETESVRQTLGQIAR
ncbi:MAG: response regulator [Burkholderiales bacterium]